MSHFSNVHEKKKKKLKEILQNRNNIDHNCQLALNCIYEVNKNQGGALINNKNKSGIQSIRKEKTKSKQKDSATRSKYSKNSEVNNRYRK